LKKSKGKSVLDSTVRLQRAARERADDQARRIPWQQLYDVRNQYIDWQEFYLWARSILEVEEEIPDRLTEILNDRCPGFLQAEKELAPKATKNRPLPFRLEDWIDEHVFELAKKEGWFNAITYYAVREPRYQRAEVCWSECVEKWRKVRPERYPTLEEWKEIAAQCDPTARLVPHERAAQACLKLVDPGRLREAVSRYIDWEALAHWAQPALERGRPLPAQVTQELNCRCPGFLEEDLTAVQDPQGGSAARLRLMTWIGNHFFQDAKNEGWFDAVLIQKRIHPRSIRIIEFSDHCDEIWDSELPSPYPSFENWRKEADSYVDLGD
jgi:hypothetical protein